MSNYRDFTFIIYFLFNSLKGNFIETYKHRVMPLMTNAEISFGLHAQAAKQLEIRIVH